MQKRFAAKLVSGVVVSGIGITLAFVTTQSAGLPAQRQAAISAPAVEWCSAGATGPQGPGCAFLPRSTAQQDPVELPPVPTFAPQQTLMTSSAGDEIRAYIDAVLADVRHVREQVEAAPAAAPAVPPAPLPDAETIRKSVEEQVEAAQAGVPQPPAALDLPELPPRGDAQDIAEAIREQVQEQIDRAQALAKAAPPADPVPPPSSSTAPGCTTEQTSGPNSSSTAIRCFQQHVRTDGASISSVVTTSSSVSSSTTSSAGVP